MEIKFNAFREGAKAPCRMTDGAAGYDLYSVEYAKLEPHKAKDEWNDSDVMEDAQ